MEYMQLKCTWSEQIALCTGIGTPLKYLIVFIMSTPPGSLIQFHDSLVMNLRERCNVCNVYGACCESSALLMCVIV